MISIVIPVYNVEAYIRSCIESVLAQTEKDLEIIVVDDGTPDASAAIAEEILAVSNAKYQIIHTENRGVSAARNTGLDAANGEFVIMVDSDDIISPAFVSDFLKMQEQSPESDIYSCGFTVFSQEKEREAEFSEDTLNTQLFSAEEAIDVFHARSVRFLLPALMLRRSFLENIRFDESVRYSEDVQFIWRCLLRNTKPVVHTAKSNYAYILHGNSTMTASGVPKILTGFEGLRGLETDFCENPKLGPIISMYYVGLLHGAAKMLTYRDFRTLFTAADCRAHLLNNNKSIAYRLMAFLLKHSLPMGYAVMRKF